MNKKKIRKELSDFVADERGSVNPLFAVCIGFGALMTYFGVESLRDERYVMATFDFALAGWNFYAAKSYKR